MECTVVSDWPTPTVSIKITSYPPASHRMIVSRVFLATPPRDPPAGEGRMKAFSSAERSSILVLSPRILPPERSLEGSMASTASFLPEAVIRVPRDSMKVLFPTPGTPVIPILTDFPAWGKLLFIIPRASSWCSGKALSIMVIAWLRRERSPLMIPSIYSPASNSCLRCFRILLTASGLMDPGGSIPVLTLRVLFCFFPPAILLHQLLHCQVRRSPGISGLRYRSLYP